MRALPAVVTTAAVLLSAPAAATARHDAPGGSTATAAMASSTALRRLTTVPPRVVVGGRGDVLATYARLHVAGLRVRVPVAVDVLTVSRCWPDVTGLSPRAGTRVRSGALVRLQVAPPVCGVASPAVPTPLPSAVVPSFGGATVARAQRWADRHGLYLQTHLPILRDGRAASFLANFGVTGQQPAPGERLALGIGKAWPGGGSFLPTPLVIAAARR